MALIGGVYPPPDWLPSSTANTRQALHQQRRFGIFLHFGINTFNNMEWSDGSLPVTSYAPTGLDPAQWVTQAKAAGATYIIAITKHHDGFTLWNSADTTYGITTPGVGNTTDVIAALATACQTQGIKLALYYSLWDRKRNADTSNTALDAAYNATMISHLTELFTNYGPVCELWLDGPWEKLPSRWGLAAIYKLFREKQPLGVMMTNQTIGDPNVAGVPSGYLPTAQVAGDPIKYAYTDFRSWDTTYIRSGTAGTGGVSNADPKTFVSNSLTYYLPIETPITINTNDLWFWHDATSDVDFQTTAYLAGAWFHSTGQKNTFVLNVCPNKVGVITSTQISHLASLATALGISAGSPLTDLAEDKTAAASTIFSATYSADKTLTGQVLGGPRWAANTGDTSAPWIYVDLGSSQSVSRVAVKEWYDASTHATSTLGTYSVQTSPDASMWTTRASLIGQSTAADETGGTSIQWGVTTFTAVSARYIRLLFSGVSTPPTLNAVRVY